MIITSFDDIISIDSKLAALFLRPDEAVNWINAVKSGIKEWVAENNKQYWEIVRYVSWQRGILGKLKQDKKSIRLTREDFAKVLLKFCPKAVAEQDTVNAIVASMEHYPFIDQLKNLKMLPEAHYVWHHIRDVEALFDGNTIVEQTESIKPREYTLEDRVEEYFRIIIDKQIDKFPYSKICVRPQYDDITPTISIETYQSRKFLNENQPSRIDAFEFVDGVLQKEQLYEFIGRYSCKQIVKLFIVSSKGLLPGVRALANSHHVGYVLLNPKERMSSEDFELPRHIEDKLKQRHYLQMLMGQMPMSVPLLVMEDSEVSPFLADVLSAHGVAVKTSQVLSVPYVSVKEIESMADSLTSKDVQDIIRRFKLYGLGADCCWIDPFYYVTSQGLSIDFDDFEDELQQGKLDVNNKCITLGSNTLGSQSLRFTLAHELGHHVLHSPLFKDKHIVTVYETTETLSSLSDNTHRRLEYQANLFASYMLMPQMLVAYLYGVLFQKHVHDVYGDNFHPLYYSPLQPETWSCYNNVVGTMTKILNVSKKAMEIRLQAMGLLTIGGQYTHVSNYLFGNKN